MSGTTEFSVAGSIRTGSLTLEISGQVAHDKKSTASVSVYTPETLSLTDAECEILAIDVRPGAIWASFNCSRLASPPTTVCAGQGFVVLENCDS